MLSDFGYILLFILGGMTFFSVTMFVAFLIRPQRPNEEKQTTYECGEDPIGNAWGQFNVRFYVIALIFILFDVEIAFMFPWAVIFADAEIVKETGSTWLWFVFGEMLLFIVILLIGLIYAWQKGFLNWEKPEAKVNNYKSKVPAELYDRINKEYS